MAYRDLRKIFHGYPKTYATEYESRFNSDQSHKSVSTYPGALRFSS